MSTRRRTARSVNKRPDVPVALRPAVRYEEGNPAAVRDLRDYLSILRRRLALILFITIGVMAIVFGVTQFMMTKQYTATSTLRVVSRAALSADAVRADDIIYLERLENTYIRLATSKPSLDELQRRAGLPAQPEVTAAIRADTELLTLSVTTESPTLSAKAANALGVLLISQVRDSNQSTIETSDKLFSERIVQLESEIAATQSKILQLENKTRTPAEDSDLVRLRESVRIKRFSATAQQTAYEEARLVQEQRANTLLMVIPASPPTSPSSPNLKLNLALGMFLGLLGGIALTFLLENFSTRLQSPTSIQNATGLELIARIPVGKLNRRAPLFEVGSALEEAFRRLRITLFALRQEHNLRTILITSADQNEGKSMIVSNLAYAIALSGHRVLVIDADMRVPTQSRTFGVMSDKGLSSVLSGDQQVGPRTILATTVPNLYLLPAGLRVTTRPSCCGCGWRSSFAPSPSRSSSS